MRRTAGRRAALAPDTIGACCQRPRSLAMLDANPMMDDPLEERLAQALSSLLSAVTERQLFLEAVLEEVTERDAAAPPSWEAVGVPVDRQPKFAPAHFHWTVSRTDLTLSLWQPLAEEPVRKLLSAPQECDPDDLDAFDRNKRQLDTRTVVLGHKRVPHSNLHIPMQQGAYDLDTITRILKRIAERHEGDWAAVSRFYIHWRGNPRFLEIVDRLPQTAASPH
jgi:hypothetical protein